MVDSSDPSCTPAFSDISGTGTPVVWEGTGWFPIDDDQSNVSLPFSFLFYDTLSSAIRIGSNGGIIFGATSGTLSYSNTDIPTGNPAPAILPFWDDLNPDQGGDVYYQTLGSAPNRRFIIQWDDVPHYGNIGNATFQVILYEGTNHIFFIYNDVYFGDSWYDYGASATIGLNNNASQANRYSFDSSSLNGVSAICFFYPSDYSDAPAGYGDVLHNIPDAQQLFLGTTADNPDSEMSMLNSAGADGDNTTDRNDENGVTFSSPAGGGDDIVATVTVTNSTGSSITLCGWMDIDLSGTFDLSERQCSGGSTDFRWIVTDTVNQQDYYSRFRVCSTSSQCSNPTGSATDGEVEDYRITYNPTAVTIGRVEIKATRVLVFLDGLGVGQMDNQALLTLLRAWDPVSAASLPSNAGRSTILAALQDYLDPDDDDQVAVFSWETLEERGTIGFFVDRRQNDSPWTRINNDMLPGLINAPMGGEYKLADPGATTGPYQYRLIEQEARGTTRSYGPFDVNLP